ncbi:MAG: hypothetical protein L6R39_003937 [Caloplaca ligustica]|nr:MAG: hypothetical protein L6R39_003937 [Caloplaca ligustica]
MAAEKLSQLSVAVTIPSWLTNTELACHVATAASRTFGRFISLESPPSAAYTAAGYELCRISYDAFDCTGPGRIMTLEFDGHLAVNSMVNTPLSSWFANPVIFSVGRDLSVQGMAKWIDSFIDPWRPNHLILVGVEANDPLVVNAVANSHAVSLVQELTSALPPKHILAFGAALTAKTILENQPDDCIESTECIELRREADTITGIYKPPLTPSVWPAITAEHGELSRYRHKQTAHTYLAPRGEQDFIYSAAITKQQVPAPASPRDIYNDRMRRVCPITEELRGNVLPYSEGFLPTTEGSEPLRILYLRKRVHPAHSADIGPHPSGSWEISLFNECEEKRKASTQDIRPI